MAWIFLALIRKTWTTGKEAKTVVFLAVDEWNQRLACSCKIFLRKMLSLPSVSWKRGLRTVMLTGSNAGVARAIADQIGIEEVIAGVSCQRRKSSWNPSNYKPSGKVAFVGDGINDAPALSVADVGLLWELEQILPSSQQIWCYN